MDGSTIRKKRKGRNGMAEITLQCYDLPAAERRERNRKEPVFTSRADLEKALKTLGFFPGIKVVVHSSLSSLGTLEGGAENFCRTLQDLVTPEGTLMFPALSRYPADGAEYEYDPLTTPVRVGAIPETFRKMPGVVRSLDPTHSFAVWGKDKIAYVRDHHKIPTMHANSPLGLLERAGGYCLMVDCPSSTTFMHVVETACGAPCLGSRTEEYPGVLNGKRIRLRAWGWRNGACRALNLEKIYGYLRERRLMTELMLGRAHLQFFRLSAYREAYSRLLLDPENGCAGCPVRPRVVSASQPTDWDAERDCLLPSGAFTGDYAPEEA